MKEFTSDELWAIRIALGALIDNLEFDNEGLTEDEYVEMNGDLDDRRADISLYIELLNAHDKVVELLKEEE